MQLSTALKEWNLQINALLSGIQPFILRKGGILESENQFELEHNEFLFFPTFIHQDPKMVKPQYREGLASIREEPATLTLTGWAKVARIFEVPSRSKLEQLADLYLWDSPLLDMRFAYRPEKPLYLVLLDSYRLPTPITIPNTLDYAGCKSWVPLSAAIDTANSVPALSPDRLAFLRTRIESTFS